jgi:hypothetical protein
VRQKIQEHEGKKYLRTIHGCTRTGHEDSAEVDVYAVLVAYNVTCPARGQAIKKLLCAGLRGKGDEMADLVGAMAALNRAIDLQHTKDDKEKHGTNQPS